MNEDVLLGTFDRAFGAEIRVVVGPFKGRIFLNIRRWLEDDTAEWRPSKSGVMLKSKELERLESAIRRAREVLDAKTDERANESEN